MKRWRLAHPAQGRGPAGTRPPAGRDDPLSGASGRHPCPRAQQSLWARREIPWQTDATGGRRRSCPPRRHGRSRDVSGQRSKGACAQIRLLGAGRVGGARASRREWPLCNECGPRQAVFIPSAAAACFAMNFSTQAPGLLLFLSGQPSHARCARGSGHDAHLTYVRALCQITRRFLT